MVSSVSVQPTASPLAPIAVQTATDSVCPGVSVTLGMSGIAKPMRGVCDPGIARVGDRDSKSMVLINIQYYYVILI